MTAVFLLVAAALEVAGDALCRVGMRDQRAGPLVLGGLALWLYGTFVNAPAWGFGRLLGVYITLFFIVSQAISVLVFREELRWPTVVAGLLIASAGMLLVFLGDA